MTEFMYRTIPQLRDARSGRIRDNLNLSFINGKLISPFPLNKICVSNQNTKQALKTFHTTISHAGSRSRGKWLVKCPYHL